MSKPVLLTCLYVLGMCSIFCRGQEAASPGQSASHDDAPSTVRYLAPGETIVSPETALSFSGPFPCDADGNIYLRSGFVGAAIRKLNPKGERVAIFQPDANPDLEVGVAGHFAVTPDGELYLLVFARKEISRYVFIFKKDGSYKEKIKLQPGFALMPSSLAVFSNGSMLITGERYDHDPKDPKLPFTGIFSADGRLLKELKLEDDAIRSKAPSTPASGAIPVGAGSQAIIRGQIESAKDGNLYVMRAMSPAVFYVISPGGEVVRRFTVDSGQGVYIPSGMHISGSRIAVLFYSPQTMDKIIKIVTTEGEELASYEELRADGKATKGVLGLAFACYTQRPERFTFLVSDEQHHIQLKLVEAR